MPCQAPIKQQWVLPISAALHLRGLPTLLFTVPIPVTVSPCCTFSNYLIPCTSSTACQNSRYIHRKDISPDKSRGESLSGQSWTPSRICTDKKPGEEIVPSACKGLDIWSQPPEHGKAPSWLQQEILKCCAPASRHCHMGPVCYNTGEQPPFILKTFDTSYFQGWMFLTSPEAGRGCVSPNVPRDSNGFGAG